MYGASRLGSLGSSARNSNLAGAADLQVYRVDVPNPPRGTPEFELINNSPPNARIELSNGDIYLTNSAGIVDEARFQPRLVAEPRDARQTSVGKDGIETDVGGHIQACSLGGTCDRVNLFPQDANFNNSGYKTLENEIRRALENGTEVGPVKVKFERIKPADPRPSKLIIEYSIDGVTKVRTFDNKAGG